MDIGFHVVNALPPVADVEDTSFDTDIVDAGAGEGVLFIYHTGVNAGGDSTITVEASDDISASTTAVVPFVYRSCVATDVWSDWTAATTAGFTSSQVSNAMHQIYVDSAEIAEEGYQYVRLSATEDTNAAVLGGVLALIVKPRYALQPDSVLD